MKSGEFHALILHILNELAIHQNGILKNNVCIYIHICIHIFICINRYIRKI
jgi:hypothetical protein